MPPAARGATVATPPADQAPTRVMQGIAVPATSVDPRAFMAATRRLEVPLHGGAYSGLGFTDQIIALQTGVIAGISLKVQASLTVTPGTGAVATTMRWPYDLLRAVRFTANGQSNLINCTGWQLKAHSIMEFTDCDDKGVTRGIGGASPGTQVNRGSLSMSSEAWGVGQAVTAIAAGTYDVELTYFVPIAWDQRSLVGAIFAQTSSTDLVLYLDWANQSDLFTLTGNGAVALAVNYFPEAILYSIPEVAGQIVIPDLSSFHGFVSSRYTSMGNGDNEIRLPGQGIGRQFMRDIFRLWNGAAPQAPLAFNATNFGSIGFRFGANDTPNLWPDGRHLAMQNERMLGTDFGSQQGFGVIDFASENAFRDSVDEGTATEMRLVVNVPAGVTLTNPIFEHVQETVFAGAAGA